MALDVDERATVNPVLQLGDILESVTIDGGAATIHLETSDSSISTLISSAEVNDIPLPTRDPMQLMLLVNGVSTGGAATGINTSQMSINGSRSLNTEVLLDGVSVTTNTTGQLGQLPSPDALQEFRVMTSAYSGGERANRGRNDLHGGEVRHQPVPRRLV